MPSSEKPSKSPRLESSKGDSDPPSSGKRGARVAFVGNSIIYFNDTPRFLTCLGKVGRESDSSSHGEDENESEIALLSPFVEHQDSCLRGGASLVSLWEEGNGMMKDGFATDAAKIDNKSDSDDGRGDHLYDVGSPTVQSLLECNDRREKWDFVVMNDYTQSPARLPSREASRSILLEKYVPLFLANDAIPIIIETAAYRFPKINNSEDLGSTHEFQRRVREGVESYVEALKNHLPPSLHPRIAPVGTAFLHIREKNRLQWDELFDPWDHFHPSPTGTFLQCCVLYCTMFGCPPPLPRTTEEIELLWKDARIMHPRMKGEDAVRFPRVEEAEYLWGVAIKICEEEKNK